MQSRVASRDSTSRDSYGRGHQTSRERPRSSEWLAGERGNSQSSLDDDRAPHEADVDDRGGVSKAATTTAKRFAKDMEVSSDWVWVVGWIG